MTSFSSSPLEWLYDFALGGVVHKTDDFTTIVRKIIVTLYGVATVTGAGCFYYAYRAAVAEQQADRNTLIALTVVWFVFAFLMCLASFIYLRVEKRTPDWLMLYLIVLACVLCWVFDLLCTFYPVRSTNIAMAIMTVASKVPYSFLIVVFICVHYVLVEIRDAFEIHIRVPDPYSGSSAEKFLFAFIGMLAMFLMPALVAASIMESGRLIKAANQTVQLAKEVAKKLVWYDTESIHTILNRLDLLNEKQKEKSDPSSDENNNNNNNNNELLAIKNDAGDAYKKKNDLELEQEEEKEQAAEKNNNNSNSVAKGIEVSDEVMVMAKIFRKIVNNLDRYRPHIPDYVLQLNAEELTDQEDDDDDALELEAGLHSSDSDSQLHLGGGKNKKKKVSRNNSGDDNDSRKTDQTQKTNSTVRTAKPSTTTTTTTKGGVLSERNNNNKNHHDVYDNNNNNNDDDDDHHASRTPGGVSSASAATGSSSSHQHHRRHQEHVFEINMEDPHEVQKQNTTTSMLLKKQNSASGGSAFAKNFGSSNYLNTSSSVTTTASPPQSFLRGTIVQRVIFAKINLKALTSRCLPSFSNGLLTANEATTFINSFVDGLLESAATHEASIHSIVADSIILSFNATKRSFSNESKALKFLVNLKALAKKSISSAVSVASTNSSSSSSSPSGSNKLVRKSSITFLKCDEQKPSSSSQRVLLINAVGTNNNNNSSYSLNQKNNTRRNSSSSSSILERTVAEMRDLVSECENLVSAAAVVGNSFCQIAGSSKRQQFFSGGFSNQHILDDCSRVAEFLSTLVVCRHIHSSAESVGFETRACGVVPALPSPSTCSSANCQSATSSVTSNNRNNQKEKLTNSFSNNHYNYSCKETIISSSNEGGGGGFLSTSEDLSCLSSGGGSKNNNNKTGSEGVNSLPSEIPITSTSLSDVMEFKYTKRKEDSPSASVPATVVANNSNINISSNTEGTRPANTTSFPQFDFLSHAVYFNEFYSSSFSRLPAVSSSGANNNNNNNNKDQTNKVDSTSFCSSVSAAVPAPVVDIFNSRRSDFLSLHSSQQQQQEEEEVEKKGEQKEEDQGAGGGGGGHVKRSGSDSLLTKTTTQPPSASNSFSAANENENGNNNDQTPKEQTLTTTARTPTEEAAKNNNAGISLSGSLTTSPLYPGNRSTGSNTSSSGGGSASERSLLISPGSLSFFDLRSPPTSLVLGGGNNDSSNSSTNNCSEIPVLVPIFEVVKQVVVSEKEDDEQQEWLYKFNNSPILPVGSHASRKVGENLETTTKAAGEEEKEEEEDDDAGHEEADDNEENSNKKKKEKRVEVRSLKQVEAYHEKLELQFNVLMTSAVVNLARKRYEKAQKCVERIRKDESCALKKILREILQEQKDEEEERQKEQEGGEEKPSSSELRSKLVLRFTDTCLSFQLIERSLSLCVVVASQQQEELQIKQQQKKTEAQNVVFG